MTLSGRCADVEVLDYEQPWNEMDPATGQRYRAPIANPEWNGKLSEEDEYFCRSCIWGSRKLMRDYYLRKDLEEQPWLFGGSLDGEQIGKGGPLWDGVFTLSRRKAQTSGGAK